MKHITSRQHPLIKLARALHDGRARREHGQFLIEGRNSIQAALDARAPLSHVLLDESQAGSWAEKFESLGVDFTLAPPELMAAASSTSGPLEILAIAPLLQPATALPDDGLILILDGVGDPGNAGTLLRASDAVGATQSAATAGSVDVMAPKTVRASAGSLWSVAMSPLHGKSPAQMAQVLAEAGIPIVAAEAHGGSDCFSMDWPARCALVIGHETRGISQAFADVALKATIPIWGRAESLNAAMAGTLLLYSWRRVIEREA